MDTVLQRKPPTTLRLFVVPVLVLRLVVFIFTQGHIFVFGLVLVRFISEQLLLRGSYPRFSDFVRDIIEFFS